MDGEQFFGIHKKHEEPVKEEKEEEKRKSKYHEFDIQKMENQANLQKSFF